MRPYRYKNTFEHRFDTCAELADDVERRICAGMANTLWAGAWADREEEVEGRCHGGCEMLDIAPEPSGDQAAVVVDWVLAARAATCERNAVAALARLYDEGCAADRAEELELDSPEAFGSDLAMQIQGHGVSWFDEHAAFPMTLPYQEWGWYHLPWDEYVVELSYAEVAALQRAMASLVQNPGDVPAHRVDRLIAKLSAATSRPAPDDGDDGAIGDA